MYHELGHDVLNLLHGQGGKMMYPFVDRDYTWDEFYNDKKYMFEYVKIKIKSFIIFLFSCQICFSQDLFSTLNSTIKETLAFHMLINQKEIDQLEKFVDDYNYRLDSDDEFVYISKLFTEENLFDIFIRTHMISSNDIKTRTEIFLSTKQ